VNFAAACAHLSRPTRASEKPQINRAATKINDVLTICEQPRQCIFRVGGVAVPSDLSPYALSLAGSLTTPRAETIHSEVLAALTGHSSVTIDCANASDMDVAFIQILVAASRFAAQTGKSIALASPPAGLLAETLRRCGFPQPKPSAAALAEVLSLPSM
jgi:anti-anti-sigma regulatory factor